MSNSAAIWEKYLEVASISDVGMRRASNQDNLCISLAPSMERWQELGHLFLVADGMGAHAAGELASEIAADKIPHVYTKYQDASAPEALRHAVCEANAAIHRKGQANEDFYNMGTTCSVLTLLPQGAVVAHVGDSRVYRLRNNTLEQLTFDHSLVWEMRASGNLDPNNMIPKNVITRSLGPYANVKVDLEGPFPVQTGDVFLLCSDGLTGQVADSELGPILANLPPKEAARVLVDLSNLRGGPDNITLIIVKILDPHMATAANQQQKPLRMGARKMKLNPISLCLFAIFTVTTLIMFLSSWQLFPGLIPGTIALASLVWILVQVIRTFSGGVVLGQGQRFGKGPYARADAASGKALINQLESITGELQKAAVGQKWEVDWTKMERLVGKANESVRNNDQPMAIRCYARSICFLMEQLREHSRRMASETGIDAGCSRTAATRNCGLPAHPKLLKSGPPARRLRESVSHRLSICRSVANAIQPHENPHPLHLSGNDQGFPGDAVQHDGVDVDCRRGAGGHTREPDTADHFAATPLRASQRALFCDSGDGSVFDLHGARSHVGKQRGGGRQINGNLTHGDCLARTGAGFCDEHIDGVLE